MKVVAPVLKTEACRLLFEIWRAARGDRLLPRRADIGPIALKAIMPKVAIFEGRGPGIVEIRLAGTAYRDILGFESTGRNLIEVTPLPFRRMRAYRSHMVMTWPCAALVEIGVTFSKRTVDSFEFLALPLDAERTEGVGLCLCAIESIGDMRWQNQDPTEIVQGPLETFQFVDIGAGIPPSVDPPADFLPL